METRFTAQAAQTMRQAIREAGGVEIFVIGKLNEAGLVHQIEVHCRGNKHSVPALLSRPKTGEVVIHNHPSGILEASHADMVLANLYGEDGVGVAIVNNDVTGALWVVEPHRQVIKTLDPAMVRHFFEERLPKVMPSFEARTGQLDMALQVTNAFNNAEIAILEAGTGTGKSLAYLVPATMWALLNDTKVAVATFTITLQSQLVTADIPILKAAGLEFSHALVKGRGNYICRRRFADTFKRQPKDRTLQALQDYIETTKDGSRSDISFFVEDTIWEDIGSDAEQTLRAKCPHYDTCFYYEARRRAARSNLMIINHHLLLADMMVKADSSGEGILPKFNRLIIDEGHHLEDSATSLFRQQLSARSIRRAVSPLLISKKKPGALEQIAHHHLSENSLLPDDRKSKALQLVDELELLGPRAFEDSELWFQEMHNTLLPDVESTKRLKPEFTLDQLWKSSTKGILDNAIQKLGRLSDRMIRLEDILDELPENLRIQHPQPLLDLARCRRRIVNQASFLQQFAGIAPPTSTPEQDPTVRWIERVTGRQKSKTSKLCLAPVEVAPALRQNLFMQIKSLVTCSATMTVDQSFNHYQQRVGLLGEPHSFDIRTAILSSPFDYKKQALLALPYDLPSPNSRDYVEKIVPFIIEAIRISNGGVFILCTSYGMLRSLYERCHFVLGDEFSLFRQGQMGRVQLLSTFIKTPRSVLFGADSFWEGVSVTGDDLKMILIPRLPFRVPTEPVQQARHELIEAQGGNPFKQYSLPQAALRLRQGFGRLIRTQKDRGSVVVLDHRILKMWYGKFFLHSLPELTRAYGNSTAILSQLREFHSKDNTPQPSIHFGEL